MNKLKNPDVWIIGIPLVIILLGALFLFKPVPYQEGPNASYYYYFEGSTPEEIQNKLVEREEKFIGSINYKYTNSERTVADIHMVNDYTGDDSVMATDRIYTLAKEGEIWKIIKVKSRWKCREIFFEIWTTSMCS